MPITLEYGVFGWGSANDKFLNPLIRTQNSIMKIILIVPARTSTDEIFNNLKSVSIKQLFSKAMFLYNRKYKTQEMTTNIHSRNTRYNTVKKITNNPLRIITF